MAIPFLIGRIIFGSYWLMAGFNHFAQLEPMSGYAKAKGTPSPKLAVAGSGHSSGAGRAQRAPLVCIQLSELFSLIHFSAGASFPMHDFWNATDAQAKQADKINFMKNMALVEALLMLLQLPHPWPVSIRVDVAKH